MQSTKNVDKPQPTKNPSRRYCCVVGCQNTKKKKPELRFYSFPSRPYEIERKYRWIVAVGRLTGDKKLWKPSKNSVICGDHFEGGKKSEDPRKPNYVPTIFPSMCEKKKDINPTEKIKKNQNRNEKKAMKSILSEESRKMPKGRLRKYPSASNVLRRLTGDHPNQLKESEENSEAAAKVNKRKRSCSTESTTERSENSPQNEKQDVATVDNVTKAAEKDDDVNSEPIISNVCERNTSVFDDDPEVNFGNKMDIYLGYKRKRNIIKWSDEEKQVTERFFKRHIKMRISPKKHEVIHLMRMYPKLFKNRKWDVIKVYVCNKYNSLSKKTTASPVQIDTIDLDDDDDDDDVPSFISVKTTDNEEGDPYLHVDIKKEPTDPSLPENKLEGVKETKEKAGNIMDEAKNKKEQPKYTIKLHSTKKAVSNQKPPTILDSKVMPANGKYLAVLKQLPAAQSGEASQEKTFQNSQTITNAAGENIVLKRLVFDAEKRCFRAVDSNELVNAMSKKIRVLSVNQEGLDTGVSSLNVLQKVPNATLDETAECRYPDPEKQTSLMEEILPVSTDDMCVLCARKKSPTHNISHLVNLVRDIAGVNLSDLHLPLRACEECVADVNVTLKLRNSIKRAYEDLTKKDDTVTINVLPPKTGRQYGKNPIIETDIVASKQTETFSDKKNENTNDDLEIVEKMDEHNPDGFKKIVLPKLIDKGDNCEQKRFLGNNYSKCHMNKDTEKICEQLCVTSSSQKEHLKECKKTDVVCNVCNRSFRCLQNLRWHMRCHVYKCEVCNKTFVYDTAKKNHIDNAHTEQEVKKARERIRKEKLNAFLPINEPNQTDPLNIMNVDEVKVKEEIDIEINDLKEEIIL